MTHRILNGLLHLAFLAGVIAALAPLADAAPSTRVGVVVTAPRVHVAAVPQAPGAVVVVTPRPAQPAPAIVAVHCAHHGCRLAHRHSHRHHRHGVVIIRR